MGSCLGEDLCNSYLLDINSPAIELAWFLPGDGNRQNPVSVFSVGPVGLHLHRQGNGAGKAAIVAFSTVNVLIFELFMAQDPCFHLLWLTASHRHLTPASFPRKAGHMPLVATRRITPQEEDSQEAMAASVSFPGLTTS